ncbi:unnamed protein product [Sphagnum troendelagicum]|uniref:Uncharacterized protein n=1 Tax=Sphagnum troendelagicum TaxID=128251 RepID=A0ABP0UWZ5_9BRYO
MMQEGRSRPVLAGRPSPPAAVHPPPLLTFPLAQTVTTTPQKNCLDLVINQAINNSNNGETSQLYHESHHCIFFMDH